MASVDTTYEQTTVTTHTTPARVWFALLRHHMRLLVPSSVAWIAGPVLTAMLVAEAYTTTMPTPEDRTALAASVEGNPAFEAMFGRAISLDTIEGFTMWRAGGPLVPAITIWGMLAAARLGRGEEDKGHDELILGGVLTRQALLISALVALVIVIGIYTILTTLGLPLVSEISAAGSIRFAAAMASAFAFFAALGMLLVQLTPSRSVAVRIGLGIIGATLGLRILSVVEQMPGWLPWATPFGWFAEIGTPEIGSNVPFLLFGLGTLIFSGAAVHLTRRRELHGSLLLGERDSGGPHKPYDSLWMHEFKQSLPAMVGFGSVALLLSTIFGLVANDFVTFIEDFPAFAQVLAQFGISDPGDPAAYIGLVITILVLVATLYAASHVSSVREDEATGRLAILLILPLERSRWLLMNTVVGLIAIAIISLLIGLGAMVGTGITGAMLSPFDALRAGLNLIPISVMFVGLGILVFGLYPQLTGPLVYTIMLSTFLLVLLDAFLDIPGWLVTLSPFEHLGLVPGEDANLLASAIFLLVGVAGITIGTIAFRRRDMMMD